MTTTFQGPLQSGDYTKLRGATANNPWWAKQFITLCKNTLVFAARVNGAISSSSYAAIVFDTVTTGAYTDIDIGETFFLSHTNDIRKAYWRGRIRLAADSTHIYINETSVNVTDDDYIFVVYDFDIWDRLSRMVGTTQYWDYDEAFHPLAPVACGLQTAYTNYDPNDGVFHIDFDVSSSYATDQGSSNVLTYQFTFVAGTYTVTSGALNTAFVGVDFNANTEQWGKLVVTDSQGTTWTRRFYIRAHGASDPPALDFKDVQITGSLDSGWNASVTAWAGVQSVLDQTFCVVWCQEYYNGTLGPLSIANNIDMVGRFHREDNHGKGDPIYSYLADVKFEIEGVCTQMQRLEEQDLTTINKGVAAVVDEISFNTPQRSIVYYCATHSTLLSLCDMAFPDGFDLTYLFSYFPNQGGNVLDAIKGIAAQINASVEFAPDGRIQVVRDTRFLTDKSGVVVVGNFDNRDFTSTDLPVDPVDKIGRLDAYGAALVSGNIAADRTRAPGAAQSFAAGESTLDAQILATATTQAVQTELNYRAGQQLAIENLTYTQDWQATTGGYHFLIPSRGQRVTHTLGTETNVRDLSFTTSDYWQVTSVTINHNNATGARTVSTHEELEPPTGDSGDTVPQIAGGTQTNPILLQPLDPFPALPDDPGNYLPDNPTPNPYPPNAPPNNGNTVAYSDGTLADLTKNLFSGGSNPNWIGKTPTLGSMVIKDIAFDRTSKKPPIGLYILTSDGTNSAFWYTADCYATPVVWTEGATFTGKFNQIRSVGINGDVMAYSSDVNGVDTTIHFQSTNGGLANEHYSAYGQTSSPDQSGTWVSGAGWEQTLVHSTTSGSKNFQSVFVGLSFMAPKTLTKIAWTFDRAIGTDIGSVEVDIFGWLTGSLVISQTSADPGPQGTSVTYTWTGSQSVDKIVFNTNAGSANFPTDPGGTCTLKSVTYTEGGGNSKVAYSTDFGATATVIDLGSSAGPNGAFDTVRTGGTNLAAANGQVKIATSVGGSYSNAAGGTLSAGQPVTIVIPYRRWPHGTAQPSATNPDYLLMGDTQISSAAVWKVDGATGTKTDVTPVAGAVGVGPNLATVWQSSSVCKMAIVVNVGGVYKLYTSLTAGSTWTFRRNVGNPIYLRCRRGDLNGTQLYLLDGATLYVSSNWGVTWTTRTLPSSNVAVAMDSYN